MQTEEREGGEGERKERSSRGFEEVEGGLRYHSKLGVLMHRCPPDICKTIVGLSSAILDFWPLDLFILLTFHFCAFC